MRVARHILIGKMLEHREAFYPLLDYIAGQRGAYEVPQSLYLREYRRRILPSGDEAAARMLTLDVLHENGVFFHLDNQASTATLHAWLVDLLRFTDTSRMRELSNADFEQLRAQFQTALENFANRSIAPGDEDYEEAKTTLFELVDTTLSRIQGNVEALTANAARLGSEFDRLDAGGHAGVDSRRLLESASALYERFIRPCLEFLSPRLGLRHERRTFTESMQGLAELHERAGVDEVAYRLLFKLTAIRSYYKDIAVIERQVQRYCRSLEAERRRYRAIEGAYNALLDAVVALRHGKLRNTQLAPGHPLFRRSAVYEGLHTHSGGFAQKINWYDAPNRIWLEEWVEARGRAVDVAGAEAVRALPAAPDVARERREAITRLCLARELAACDDLVGALHHWLPASLEDYALTDLVVAYQALMGLARVRRGLRWTRRRGRVTDGRYYFEYLVAGFAAPGGEEASRELPSQR